MGQSIKRVGCGGLAIAVCMAGMGLPGLAYAQAAGAESAAAAAFASEVSDAALPAAIIPALTPVSLRIEQELGSKISHSGDAFRISLALPIVIEGTELVPAGVEGLGEVVHAKRAASAERRANWCSPRAIWKSTADTSICGVSHSWGEARTTWI